VGSRLKYLINLARQIGWSRLISRNNRNNMPIARLVGHLSLTWFQNLCFKTKLCSFHEGMRGCTRSVVDWILQNKFTTWYNYDTDLLLHAHRAGFRIGEIPVPPNYRNRAKSSAPAYRYGLRTLIYSVRIALKVYGFVHKKE